MKNKDLAKDYLSRSQKRLKAIATLYEEKSWADVVRESQEVVELSLKGLLRYSHIEVPRLHDVSEVLLENKEKIDKKLHSHLANFSEISRQLRRDRELAFYGSEDLTPSEFYKKSDAKRAMDQATLIVSHLSDIILKS